MNGRPAYDVAPPAPRRLRPGAVAATRPWHCVKVGGRRVLTRSPVHPPHSAQAKLVRSAAVSRAAGGGRVATVPFGVGAPDGFALDAVGRR